MLSSPTPMAFATPTAARAFRALCSPTILTRVWNLARDAKARIQLSSQRLCPLSSNGSLYGCLHTWTDTGSHNQHRAHADGSCHAGGDEHRRVTVGYGKIPRQCGRQHGAGV